MKKRYCQANNFQNPPCPVGWGSAGSKYVLSCMDEPKEENCRYLVTEGPEVEFCSTCGTALGMKES